MTCQIGGRRLSVRLGVCLFHRIMIGRGVSLPFVACMIVSRKEEEEDGNSLPRRGGGERKPILAYLLSCHLGME